MDLKEKNILVTGATSGIGSAVAHCLARRGCRLTLCGRNEESLASLEENYPEALVLFADVSQADSCKNIIRQAVEHGGALDGLIHCAGISVMQPMRFYQPDTLYETMNTNLYSAFHLMNFFRKPRHHAPESHFVVCSSSLAQHGQASSSAYGASKAALEGAIRAWAVELAREGIRVNAIAPGYVNTPMFEKAQMWMAEESLALLKARHPLGFGDPADIANAAAFLLSSASKWISGIVLPVDGGFHAS